jgi:hypothetical protein
MNMGEDLIIAKPYRGESRPIGTTAPLESAE